MTKLRKGDIVTFKATVIEVAKFNDEQKIMAKILPNGETLGWCIPTENAFVPDKLTLKPGDRVKWSQRTAQGGEYEVLLVTETQATVRKVGNWNIEVADLNHLRRI